MCVNKERIIELTKTLREIVHEASIQYNETKKNIDDEVDFYGKVEPFVKRVDDLLSEWRPLTVAWLESGQAKYLNKQQIESAVEHLKTVSVLVFQPKSSKKRVIEMLKSIRYILDLVLSEIS